MRKMGVTTQEWAERRRTLDRVYYRNKLISAAFGVNLIPLEELHEAIMFVYRAETGSMLKAAKRLGVDHSTLYRWQRNSGTG